MKVMGTEKKSEMDVKSTHNENDFCDFEIQMEKNHEIKNQSHPFHEWRTEMCALGQCTFVIDHPRNRIRLRWRTSENNEY